jgi:hypothetical protein
MSTGEVFGFKADAWERAKREAILAIVSAGRRDQFISYSELAAAIRSVHVEPHDFAMNRLLDEISKEEEAAGRGILTALVVFKGEPVPGEGFWATARDVGRVWSDKWVFWAEEVKRVMKECKTHPFCP